MIRRRTQSDNDPLNPDDSTDMKSISETIEDTKKSRKQREFQLISWYWPLVILALGCALYYSVYLQDHRLPTPISKIEAEENPRLFSAERSKNGLQKLTDLGPRVVGTDANEVHAPLVIENEIKEIKSKAHSSQSILVQRQKGSGVYYLGFEYGLTNIYGNIQNVLVMMEGSEGNHSILINCHFDSVTGSPGASDDGISCAVMMELIRVLSLSNQRLKHNLVFLFNGAEEVPLEGSHLSLQHEWTKKCSIVLNMDSAGHGGRAMLFQSGPKHSWLFKYYAQNAPHPHALVMSEEFFQSGIMPSDSDFRIFRDFGNMIGFDFAFARNGYVYHTTHDTEPDLPAGSHQHLGDNILAVIRELGFAPELDNMEENADGEVIYYDYLGFYMISYSTKAGIIINVLAIIVAIFSIVVYIGQILQWSWLSQFSARNRKRDLYISKCITGKLLTDENLEPKIDTKNKEHCSSYETSNWFTCSFESLIEYDVMKELGIAAFGCVSGQFFGIALAILVSFIINYIADYAMPWYSNVWLIFPIYWCPCFIAYATVTYLIDLWREEKRNLTPVATTQLNLIAAQIPPIFIFVALTGLGIRSSAMFLFPVFSSGIANLLLHLTDLHKTAYKWIFVYILVHLPSLAFQFYLALMTYSLLIPITGRSGIDSADLTLALVSSVLLIYSISSMMPLMGVVKNRILTLVVLGIFSITMIMISLTTPVGFPYKTGPFNAIPQRYWIMHSDREFYDESQTLRRHDTGYFVLNQDPNSPLTVPDKYKDRMQTMTLDCETEMNCGLPYYSTRMVDLGPTSSWIPASAPEIPNETDLLVTKVCQTIGDESTCQLECALKGPDRLTMTFSPRFGAELIKWSLDSPIIATSEWQGRPYYYVMLVRGEITGDYNITLDFRVTSEQRNGSPVVDIGLAGNHVHHESEMTKDFQNFIKSFPPWTTIMGWISAYKVYVF